MRTWHFIPSNISQLQKPITIMRRRIFLVSSLALSIDAVSADPATWNCNQSQDGKQWGCSAAPETATPSTPNTVMPAVDPEPAAAPPSQNRALSPQNAPRTEVAAPIEATPEPAEMRVLPNPANIPSKPAKVQAAETKCTTGKCGGVNTAIEDPSTFTRLLEPTFNHQQELVFSRLQNRLRANPWESCESSFKAPNPFDSLPSNKALRETSPMDIESDYSEVYDKEVYSFVKNVKVKRADQDVDADQVTFNNTSNTVDAQGNVYYTEDELSMFSNSVLLSLDSDKAKLRDTLFISPGAPIRGQAGAVYRETKEFSHYKDVSYTSCPPGNQDWMIHASRLKMNKETGQAAAKDAWLEFKGVPVFYTPFISFPMDKRRISGFLAPHWGTSGQNGIDVSIPFYWNIAPNYDLLFRPRVLAKRGLMLGFDFRHMNSFMRNKLSLNVLPYDNKRNDQTRYQASFQNQSILSPHISTNINLNYVSDKKYISELGNSLSFTDIRHVQSIADLYYQREGVSFLTRMENFQTIDQSIPTNQRPYRKLPQVSLNLTHAFDNLPLNVGLENEFVVFNHSYNVDGERFNIKPYISTPFKATAGFAIPKVSLLHTEYLLNNQLPGRSSEISRTVPIASFDTGLFAETDFAFNNAKWTHTLEPRLFYVYIPYVKQTAQPVFDTSLYDFNFDSMFRENRFTGVDRIQDTNQVTLALTSRLLDADSGKERLKFSVGNVLYLKNRHAMLAEDDYVTRNNFANLTQYYRYQLTQPNPNTFSNVVVELSGRFNDQLGFSSGLQWDPYTAQIPCDLNNPNPTCLKDSKDIPRSQIALHYHNQNNQIVNLGYRYRQDLISTGDVSFRWPLLANWFAVGRMQYSLLYGKATESFMGLEKENCCWRFRIIGRRYINGLNVTDVTNQGPSLLPQQIISSEAQTAIMFQIELKSLSAFGDNVDDFLQRNIYGYTK